MEIKDVLTMAKDNYLQSCDIKKISETLRRKSERVVKKVLDGSRYSVEMKKKKNKK